MHYHSINFSLGDCVIVKKSYDKNIKTKKEKLEGFFGHGNWIIIEKIGLNSYKIQNLLDKKGKKLSTKID